MICKINSFATIASELAATSFLGISDSIASVGMLALVFHYECFCVVVAFGLLPLLQSF